MNTLLNVISKCSSDDIQISFFPVKNKSYYIFVIVDIGSNNKVQGINELKDITSEISVITKNKHVIDTYSFSNGKKVKVDNLCYYCKELYKKYFEPTIANKKKEQFNIFICHPISNSPLYIIDDIAVANFIKSIHSYINMVNSVKLSQSKENANVTKILFNENSKLTISIKPLEHLSKQKIYSLIQNSVKDFLLTDIFTFYITSKSNNENDNYYEEVNKEIIDGITCSTMKIKRQKLSESPIKITNDKVILAEISGIIKRPIMCIDEKKEKLSHLIENYFKTFFYINNLINEQKNNKEKKNLLTDESSGTTDSNDFFFSDENFDEQIDDFTKEQLIKSDNLKSIEDDKGFLLELNFLNSMKIDIETISAEFIECIESYLFNKINSHFQEITIQEKLADSLIFGAVIPYEKRMYKLKKNPQNNLNETFKKMVYSYQELPIKITLIVRTFYILPNKISCAINIPFKKLIKDALSNCFKSFYTEEQHKTYKMKENFTDFTEMLEKILKSKLFKDDKDYNYLKTYLNDRFNSDTQIKEIEDITKAYAKDIFNTNRD